MTLCDPTDCSPPGSSEIFQAKVLEWVTISSSWGSSWTRDHMFVSCIGRQILNHWATWEAPSGQRSASFQLAGCKNPDSLLGLLWHPSVGEGHLVTFRWRWKPWLSMGSPLTLYLGQGLLITCWDEKLWLRSWAPPQWGDRLTFLYPGSVEILAPSSIALTRWHRAFFVVFDWSRAVIHQVACHEARESRLPLGLFLAFALGIFEFQFH